MKLISKVDQRLMEQNQRLIQHLNDQRHNRLEILQLISEITGQRLDSSVEIKLPFYSDYGHNILIGKNVNIGSNTMLSDIYQIKIADGVWIGSGVTFLTNDFSCERQGPIKINQNQSKCQNRQSSYDLTECHDRRKFCDSCR